MNNGACAICHRVLDWETDKDGNNGHWVHTTQDRKVEDHAPVWTPEDASTQYRCDFCNVNDPSFELPCEDFVIPLLDGHHHSVGEWMCCGECAPLVSSGDWDTLMSRVMKVSPSFSSAALGNAMNGRRFLSALYAEIDHHKIGPLKQWTPPQ